MVTEMMNQTIWTRNVKTGIPDAHRNATINNNGCHAYYRENGCTCELWGGFHLTEELARKDTQDACKELLDFYTSNAKTMRASLGNSRERKTYEKAGL
jgi:hypothetical protein